MPDATRLHMVFSEEPLVGFIVGEDYFLPLFRAF